MPHLRWPSPPSHFVAGLGLSGFGSSGNFTLTGLQTVNNLVFLGICQPPSIEDMVTIISGMRANAGAKAGLSILGFQIQTRDLLKVAFTTVYKYLHFYLTDEDKEDLGFGVIFVEHLLCKVGRWVNRLGKFYDLRKAAEVFAKDQMWIAGANMEDSEKFPIPLRCTQDDLNRVHDAVR